MYFIHFVSVLNEKQSFVSFQSYCFHLYLKVPFKSKFPSLIKFVMSFKNPSNILLCLADKNEKFCEDKCFLYVYIILHALVIPLFSGKYQLLSTRKGERFFVNLLSYCSVRVRKIINWPYPYLQRYKHF